MPKVTAPAARKTLRRSPITRERVTSAAFTLIDAEGADALSARKLARALGCEAMSLYHHVSNMHEVLNDVVGHLLQQCPAPKLDARDVRRELLRSADDYLALAVKHPRVFALAAGRRWISPSAYALAAALVALFEAGGLSSRQAGRAARAVAAYLNGAGMALSGWQLQQAHGTASPTPDETPAVRKLRRQFDPQHLRTDIDAGLRVLIDGLLRR